jgi:hypothetical protein
MEPKKEKRRGTIMHQLRTVVCLAGLMLFSAAASAQQDVISTIADGGTPGLYNPMGATSDSAGNIYIADTSNCVVRKVDATGNITTFAGMLGSCGYNKDNVPPTSAQLNQPSKVVVYQGYVYIADTHNCIIRKVDITNPQSPMVSTFAGTPGSCNYGGDGGAAISAQLNMPYGVAVDSSGNVYIADTLNQRIRMVSVSDGKIRTVAGNGTQAYLGDGGPASGTELNQPRDVALDALLGNLYIADYGNLRIRMVVNPPAGNTSTFAGTGTCGPSGDGILATGSSVCYASGLAVDAAGDVLIADNSQNRIRWVDGQNIIHTVAGNGNYGYTNDGVPATSTPLAAPAGVGVDPLGNIYVADTGNNRVRKVTAVAGLSASPMSLTFASQGVGTTSGSQPVTLRAIGPLGALGFSNTPPAHDFIPSGCVPGQLQSGVPCTMDIVFQPTTTGQLNETITIKDNGFFSQSLPISVQGTGLGASLSPCPLIFAPQIAGTSATQQVTLAWSYPLTFTGSVTGTNQSDFAIQPSSTCLSSPSPPSCTYNISFKPTLNGGESGTLGVNSATTGFQVAQCSLSGTGIGAALSPNPLVFPPQFANTTSAPKIITLSNHLSTPLTNIQAKITGVTMWGMQVIDFAIKPLPLLGHLKPCLGSLGAGDHCGYGITFSPYMFPPVGTLTVTGLYGTQQATATAALGGTIEFLPAPNPRR